MTILKQLQLRHMTILKQLQLLQVLKAELKASTAKGFDMAIGQA